MNIIWVGTLFIISGTALCGFGVISTLSTKTDAAAEGKQFLTVNRGSIVEARTVRNASFGDSTEGPVCLLVYREEGE